MRNILPVWTKLWHPGCLIGVTQMKRTFRNRQAAFTLVEIMIVVAIIGLLAAIAIPNFIKARATSQSNACINNLRQIDGGEQDWALENKQNSSAAPTTLANLVSGGYVRTPGGNTPSCPASGTYTTAAAISIMPTIGCSLSTLTSSPHRLQ
jgi:prepilin-type N-terminal cleavage/methylation domain-containing protein